MALKCVKCGLKFPLVPPKHKCEKCGGALEYEFDLQKYSKIKFSGQMRFWRYKPLLPSVKHLISLGEGGTRLHKA